MSNKTQGPAFLQDLTEDAVLNATLAPDAISGKTEVTLFVLRLVALFKSLDPIFHESTDGHEFLAYVAKLEDDQAVEGTVILTRTAEGKVSNVIIGHSPYKAVQKMAAALGQ